MKPTLSLTAGCVLGAGIWLLSPVLTGHSEPWDDRGVYFPLALLLCGLCCGFLARGWFMLAVLGLYLGQMAVMFLQVPDGANRAMWLVGAVALAMYTGIALVASGLGAAFRWLVWPDRRT